MIRVGSLLLVAGWVSGCSGAGSLLTQWEYTGGPVAQNISTVFVPAFADQMLFAGLETGELFQSSNGGATWRKLGTVRKGAVIYELLADPDTATILYAVTSGGAYRSVDGGAEWSEILFAGTSTGLGCRAVAIDPWSPQNIYIGSIGRGMFRSTDRGASWQPATAGEDSTLLMGDVHDIAINVQRPDEVYAAFATGGLLRSPDGGRSWSRITPEYSTAGAAITQIVLHPSADGELLYGTASGNVFKSVDGGSSWSPTRQGLEADRVLSICTEAEDPSVVYAGTGIGVLHSSDFGTSWQPLSSSLPPVPVAVTVGSSVAGSALYAYGQGIGLQVSTDGGTRWESIDENLGGATVSLIDTDRNGSAIYAAAGEVVLRFDAEASLWRAGSGGLRGGAIRALTVDPDSALVVFVSTVAGVFKTVDGGQSWRQTLRRLSMAPDLLLPHPWIPTRLIASGEQGIWVSTDKGNSWGQAQPVKDPFRVSALGFSPTNAGIIFGCTDDGVVSTTDGGFRWGAARFGMGPVAISAISMGADDPRTVYAWGRDGAGFRSTNGGLEWATYEPPWPAGARIQIAVDRFRPSSMVAVVNGSQVYLSDNGGGSWLRVLEKGFPLEVRSVHWNSTSGVLLVGTQERGAFRLPLRHLIGEEGARR